MHITHCGNWKFCSVTTESWICLLCPDSGKYMHSYQYRSALRWVLEVCSYVHIWHWVTLLDYNLRSVDPMTFSIQRNMIRRSKTVRERWCKELLQLSRSLVLYLNTKVSILHHQTFFSAVLLINSFSEGVMHFLLILLV